jgi:general secretion pathway protein C
MVTRWLAFGVWAAVAASAVAWGLRLFVPSLPVPAHAGVALPSAAVGDLERLLGAAPVAAADEEEEPEPVADARFQLIGVVAPRPAAASGEGLALISIDGKPPRAFRVGATVDGEQVLQAVQPRGATLGPRGGAALVALSIPPLAPASTGTLPSVGAGGVGSRNVGMPGSFGAVPGRAPLGQPSPRYMPPGLRGNVPQPAPLVEDPDTSVAEPVIDGSDANSGNPNEMQSR